MALPPYMTSPVQPAPMGGGVPANPLLGGGGMRRRMLDLAANPLFGAGIGLLSQGPSLTPQGPMAGVGAGLAMAQRSGQLLAEQDRAAAELQMRRQEMDWKRDQMEREARQRAARRGAVASELEAQGMTPERAGRLAEAGLGDAFIGPPAASPSAIQMAEWMANPDVPQAAKDAAMALRRAGATQVQVGSGGIKAQTELGKTLNDLNAVVDQRKAQDTPELAATEEALRAKLAKQTTGGAEQEERATKYATTLDAAERLMELREANPELVGPIEGRITGAQGRLGMGGEQAGEMRALEATMRSRLGTALSGAAIPESEWPTYEAQLPLASDSDEVAAGKMKALRETLEFLEERRRDLFGQGGMSIDWEATKAPKTTALPPQGVVQWNELPGS